MLLSDGHEDIVRSFGLKGGMLPIGRASSMQSVGASWHHWRRMFGHLNLSRTRGREGGSSRVKSQDDGLQDPPKGRVPVMTGKMNVGTPPRTTIFPHEVHIAADTYSWD